MDRPLRLIVPFAAALLASQGALAHVGIGPTASLGAGLAHPLMGLDHLLAMVTVGVWAAAMGGRAMWLLPCGFLMAVLLGGVAGAAALPLPLVELGIAASLIALGLALASNLRPSVLTALAVAALFGLFHGHAHGTEMPVDAQGLLYGAGFLAATALLHLAGVGIGYTLHRPATARLLRLGGGAVAAAGLVLLIAA